MFREELECRGDGKSNSLPLSLQRAGEVYGEKSILATEARELQSRLFYMSEERDKHLSLIDEASFC